MSNHSEVGGRRKARITYTAAELHSAMESYRMSQKYVEISKILVSCLWYESF